jgi:hypothetical protein
MKVKWTLERWIDFFKSDFKITKDEVDFDIIWSILGFYLPYLFMNSSFS